MATTMTAQEAKEHLDALMDRASEGFDDVIVERDGEPRAVIVSFSDFQAMVELRAARREQAVADLRRISEEVSSRNQDLTDDQIEELANRASREATDSIISKLKQREQLKA